MAGLLSPDIKDRAMKRTVVVIMLTLRDNRQNMPSNHHMSVYRCYMLTKRGCSGRRNGLRVPQDGVRYT